MKRGVLVLGICLLTAGFWGNRASAQCSICTKTAQQMGEKPAKGMNSGIIYLMLTPLAIMGYIGYRWYQSNR
ncbi:MAG: hypothetical protein ACO1NW_01580 [Chitinophagaceae bacterium]|uniref:hypothetical protein n=1 Tax=Parasegetibacter sp. NRK P23 TaxID=2942999 RepID=UPI0020434FBA|nr:hypothetical protein [Parasegetibacter sp. NRK P23]MCM5530031.1 hypothetical protein [Parasegetibacter sp. NRK P23]